LRATVPVVRLAGARDASARLVAATGAGFPAFAGAALAFGDASLTTPSVSWTARFGVAGEAVDAVEDGTASCVWAAAGVGTAFCRVAM
jgi:hypothetical protein